MDEVPCMSSLPVRRERVTSLLTVILLDDPEPKLPPLSSWKTCPQCRTKVRMELFLRHLAGHQWRKKTDLPRESPTVPRGWGAQGYFSSSFSSWLPITA
jgi:hypothetical protein